MNDNLDEQAEEFVTQKLHTRQHKFNDSSRASKRCNNIHQTNTNHPRSRGWYLSVPLIFITIQFIAFLWYTKAINEKITLLENTQQKITDMQYTNTQAKVDSLNTQLKIDKIQQQQDKINQKIFKIQTDLHKTNKLIYKIETN